jgi:aldose 1-epimerase
MTDPVALSSDYLRVDILPTGASLTGVYLPDLPRNLVLGFDPATRATEVPIYAGAIVGPVANRVRVGCVTIRGQRYQMVLNEGGRTALHSGPQGLHARTWEIVEQTDSLVTLRCDLPDGACGLPGNRRIEATYTAEGARLRLDIRATTDQPTPMNIAAHPYWNLDGQPDLSQHSLSIRTERYTPTTGDNLPTGQINPVAGTVFDFRQGATIPLTADLDINYCRSVAMQAEPTSAATLTGGDGTTLHIATNTPGLQVYNGAHLPFMPNALSNGRDLLPYGAIALEPQHWPDAPHHAHFPQITLWPGQTYHQITTYTLSRHP